MKVEWTKSGGSAVTLGDDASGHTVQLHELTGEALVQSDPLVRGTNMQHLPRGNVGGVCRFTAGKSHATRVAALQALVTERGRLNEKGLITLTMDGTTFKMDNAVLRSVTPTFNGTRLHLTYIFLIATLVTP